MIARFLSGGYCGLFSGILPLYLSELSPINFRGLVGGLYQLLIVIGILTTNIYGLKKVLGNDRLWPILAGAFHYFPMIFHIGLFFSVESPKYLYLNKNDIAAAQIALTKLRGAKNVELIKNEIAMLENERVMQARLRKISWSEFFSDISLRHPLLVAFLGHLCQQLSGVNVVTFYSTIIFKSIGLDGDWPMYASLILVVVQLFMAVICMSLIERAGRRILMISGMTGMSLFAFLIGIFRVFGVRIFGIQ